jgi:hypothetical protein
MKKLFLLQSELDSARKAFRVSGSEADAVRCEKLYKELVERKRHGESKKSIR